MYIRYVKLQNIDDVCAILSKDISEYLNDLNSIDWDTWFYVMHSQLRKTNRYRTLFL